MFCFRGWDSFFFFLNRLIYFNLKEEFPVYDIQGCLSMQVGFLTVTFLECTESVYFERKKHVKPISYVKLDSVYRVLTAETSHNTGAPV